MRDTSPLPYPRFPPERFAPPWSATGAPASALDALLAPLLMRAGEVAVSRFGAAQVRRKDDGTPVTDADLAAQAILLDGILAAFPRDGVEAEEDARREGGPRLWSIDPLDGTAAFSEGLAYWGPCVAALERDRVVAGALWLPRVREYYFLEAGLGAFRNGAPLNPLPKDPAREPCRLSVLYIPSRLHAGARLDWPGKARCLGSSAAHLALVAAGSAAAALVPPGWKRWDTALGLALIEAVGGGAMLPDGRALDPVAHEGQPFVVGDVGALSWLTTPGRLRPLTAEPSFRD